MVLPVIILEYSLSQEVGWGIFLLFQGDILTIFPKLSKLFYTKNSKITLLKLQFRKKKKHLRVTIINGQWGGKFTSLQYTYWCIISPGNFLSQQKHVFSRADGLSSRQVPIPVYTYDWRELIVYLVPVTRKNLNKYTCTILLSSFMNNYNCFFVHKCSMRTHMVGLNKIYVLSLVHGLNKSCSRLFL